MSIDAKGFIDKYEKFYFENLYNERKSLGLKYVSITPVDDEKEIVCKLKHKEHDKDIIAWKVGIFSKDEYKKDKIIKGRGGIIDVDEYICKINKEEELKSLIREVEKSKYSVKKLVEWFEWLTTRSPEGFGSVYIINSMFFLSGGMIPIYDSFAYKALLALYLDKSPNDIVVNTIPSKEETASVIMHLVNYMRLIEEIFGETKTCESEIYKYCENKGYTSRGLDRALWVYGHTKDSKYKYEIIG